MDIITLTSDGSILHEGRIVESEPLAFLPFKTELQDGYTLRSYFTMLHKYPLLTKLSPFFAAYMKQYSECPQAGCITNAFHHLELSKTIEMIGFPGKPQIDIYISFNGICGDQACELKPYPLKNLLDMALKLGKLKHIVFGDKVDIFEFETVFNLFEFLDGIAWVLSFQSGSIECLLRR